jgi:hypothetical protein
MLLTNNTASDAIERWLTIRLITTGGAGASEELATIKLHSPSERVRELYKVLARSPVLASRVECLPVADQLKLSMELIGNAQQGRPRTRTVTPMTTAAQCREHRRGRPRHR